MLILRRMQESRVVAVRFVSAGYQTCSAREVSFRPVDVYQGEAGGGSGAVDDENTCQDRSGCDNKSDTLSRLLVEGTAI